MTNYIESIAEHSDSMIDAGTATAAWKLLATASMPASCQDSVVGSQDKMLSKLSSPPKVVSPQPPETKMMLSTVATLSPLLGEGSWPPPVSLHSSCLPPV